MYMYIVYMYMYMYIDTRCISLVNLLGYTVELSIRVLAKPEKKQRGITATGGGGRLPIPFGVLESASM